MSVKQAITIVPILQSAPIHRDLTLARVTVALQAMVSSAQVCKLPQGTPRICTKALTLWKIAILVVY